MRGSIRIKVIFAGATAATAFPVSRLTGLGFRFTWYLTSILGMLFFMALWAIVELRKDFRASETTGSTADTKH